MQEEDKTRNFRSKEMNDKQGKKQSEGIFMIVIKKVIKKKSVCLRVLLLRL